MRLINADALREGWREWNPYDSIEANTVLDSIDEQPTIDAVQVVHGHLEVNGMNPWDGTVGNFKCTICGGISMKDTRYCPHCGAKMDEEDIIDG